MELFSIRIQRTFQLVSTRQVHQRPARAPANAETGAGGG